MEIDPERFPFASTTRHKSQQECIPVGCVPSAAVAVSAPEGGGAWSRGVSAPVGVSAPGGCLVPGGGLVVKIGIINCHNKMALQILTTNKSKISDISDILFIIIIGGSLESLLAFLGSRGT